MPDGNLEQDIAQLEQQLAEKRRALEGTGGSVEREPSDRELVHEAVGEKIQQQMPAYQPSGTQTSDDDSGSSWSDPAIAQEVQSLVNIAFTKSLDEAIAGAIKTGNAAVIDSFHDLLRDELLKELITRGKLKPLPIG